MSVSKVTNFYLLLQTLYFAPQSIEFPIQTLCSILYTNMVSVTLEKIVFVKAMYCLQFDFSYNLCSDNIHFQANNLIFLYYFSQRMQIIADRIHCRGDIVIKR